MIEELMSHYMRNYQDDQMDEMEEEYLMKTRDVHPSKL